MTVASWRQRLGLKGRFENEVQHETVLVSIQGEGQRALKSMVEGTYKLLPKCGGACGSLMKRIESPNGKCDNDDCWFFLSSGKNTLSNGDKFVFANTRHRTDTSEYRETYLELDSNYRTVFSKQTDRDDEDHTRVDSVRGFLSGKWVEWEGFYTSGKTTTMQVSYPTSLSRIASYPGAWKESPEFVSCTVSLSPTDSTLSRCLNSGGALEVNLSKASKILHSVAFLTARMTIPALFGESRWLQLESYAGSLAPEEACPKCAPKKPSVSWKALEKGKRIIYEPMEDFQEAAHFERAIKNRPHPWIVRFLANDDSLQLQVACNAVSLVQRSLGLFDPGTLQRKLFSSFEIKGKRPDLNYEWRVVPHTEKINGEFPPLKFTSNKLDPQASQPPNFAKYRLRKEQLRSLTWMLQQEASFEPFYEEEVCEELLPGLNWRAEGRVRRPVGAQCGIIADEVGYGKTAITLGLVDAAETVNGAPPSPPEGFREGFIHTKATLVLVPKHLMGQWPDEVKKFLGDSKKVFVIKDLNSMNSLTIGDVLDADIVVASFAVINNQKYFERLAQFCGIDPDRLPSDANGGRRFGTVYNEIRSTLKMRANQIKTDSSSLYSNIKADAESHMEAEGALRLDGKKAVYKQGASALKTKKVGSTKKRSFDEDYWGLSTSVVKKDFRKMKSPSFEMFFWNRCVVDEFTYLGKHGRVLEVIHRLNSSFKCKWECHTLDISTCTASISPSMTLPGFLSGTPRHGNFNDIQYLANLIGIHLGVNEPLPSEKVSKRYLDGQESTGAESLAQFLDRKSMQWHERRHSLAQTFLDRFVRQNIAEIDEIPYNEHDIVLELPPVERAIYLELSTHLESLDMNNKNAMKSKKSTSGDRDERMQKILQESATAEEALLKACSHFNMSKDDSCDALKTIKDIINVRVEEKSQLREVMVQSLLRVFRQRKYILGIQPEWCYVTETGKGEVRDGLGEYLELVTAGKAIPHGGDDEIHLQVERIVEEAEKEFKETSYSGDPFKENESDEEDPDESPNKKQKTSEKTPKVVDNFTLYEMKQKLRNNMHSFRALVKEFCGRERSLRYIQWIRRFQKESVITCQGCNKEGIKADAGGILSCCGHVGCLECLQRMAAHDKCINTKCDARVNPAHVVASTKLGFERHDVSGGRFGRKLTAIVKKVESIVGKSDDRVLVFCQFDDLQEKVKKALVLSNIEALEVKGTVQQQIKVISKFQKEMPSKSDPRVLLLKMDDEQAAGLNLTNLNHAIFVHPLLADSLQEYKAYETQSIGRIRRFGQQKTVHVWRFLMKDTIDQQIFTERTGRDFPDPTENWD
eukprot:scaffold4223_cov189-Amphora_coffeaeformis.AAC.54